MASLCMYFPQLRNNTNFCNEFYELFVLDFSYHSDIVCTLLQKGTKAPQAAGRIHTDFEKGFIMAEVMKFDDFKEEGSEAALKV